MWLYSKLYELSQNHYRTYRCLSNGHVKNTRRTTLFGDKLHIVWNWQHNDVPKYSPLSKQFSNSFVARCRIVEALFWDGSRFEILLLQAWPSPPGGGRGWASQFIFPSQRSPTIHFASQLDCAARSPVEVYNFPGAQAMKTFECFRGTLHNVIISEGHQDRQTKLSWIFELSFATVIYVLCSPGNYKIRPLLPIFHVRPRTVWGLVLRFAQKLPWKCHILWYMGGFTFHMTDGRCWMIIINILKCSYACH